MQCKPKPPEHHPRTREPNLDVLASLSHPGPDIFSAELFTPTGRHKKQRKPRTPEYVKLSELAQRLDCTHTHLCNLAERGVIPAIKIGALYRVRLVDAEKVLREGAPWK